MTVNCQIETFHPYAGRKLRQVKTASENPWHWADSLGAFFLSVNKPGCKEDWAQTSCQEEAESKPGRSLDQLSHSERTLEKKNQLRTFKAKFSAQRKCIRPRRQRIRKKCETEGKGTGIFVTYVFWYLDLGSQPQKEEVTKYKNRPCGQALRMQPNGF